MEKIISSVHEFFLEQGFKCIALDEDDKKEQQITKVKIDPKQEAFCFVYKTKDGDIVVFKAIQATSSMLILTAGTKGDTSVLTMNVDIEDYDGKSKSKKSISDLLTLFANKIVEPLKNAKKKKEEKKDDKKKEEKKDDKKKEEKKEDKKQKNEDEYVNPLLVQPPVRPVPMMPSNPDFDSDLYPSFPNNPNNPFGGGNVVGPNNPMFGAGRGRGGMRPRFDPFGPFNPRGGPPDMFG